jgi:hypothetical protein
LTGDVSVVPEPTSLTLLGVGVVAAVWARRRRRSFDPRRAGFSVLS